MAEIYKINVLDKKGNEVSLEQYQGKVLLIVNTATGCGFTPQYKELEAIIKWNFTKFLIDRSGNVVARFEPTHNMNDVEKQVESLL